MGAIGSTALAVVRFVYSFIFGDDWTVAAVIVLGLFATAWLVANRIPAWWLVPLLAIAMTGVSLLRSRQRPSRAPTRG
jgi:Zn-dependent protease with chaperone function